jgi:rhodanese-related sulfurtransferase
LEARFGAGFRHGSVKDAYSLPVERSGEALLTVERLLAEARSKLKRLAPTEAKAAVGDGALLIDIRSELQRSRDGELPGAKRIPRNVLEWRLDPSCPHCDREVARRDVALILICNEGYQSSLAAATARCFGLRATDVIGGFHAWRAAGLPIEHPGQDPARI